MNGLHIIAELNACNPDIPALRNSLALRTLCLDACRHSGLEAVGECFHQFVDSKGEPAGATGTVVLAESHLAIHTWPELGSVTLDLYVCNYSRDNSGNAQTAFSILVQAFVPQSVQQRHIQRGAL